MDRGNARGNTTIFQCSAPLTAASYRVVPRAMAARPLSPSVAMVAPLLPLLLALGVAAGDDAVATTGGLALRDLRVEHLANPLGLDKSNPRFQWTIIAPAGSRAVTQASYRVAVTAEGTSTPVWDSGTVAGNVRTSQMSTSNGNSPIFGALVLPYSSRCLL